MLNNYSNASSILVVLVVVSDYVCILNIVVYCNGMFVYLY